MEKRNIRRDKKFLTLSRAEQSASDKARNYYFKALKRCHLVYFQTNSYFVFKFEKNFYITINEIGLTGIFTYKEDHVANFTVAKELPKKTEFYDALYNRYHHKLDDCLGNEILHDQLLPVSPFPRFPVWYVLSKLKGIDVAHP